MSDLTKYKQRRTIDLLFIWVGTWLLAGAVAIAYMPFSGVKEIISNWKNVGQVQDISITILSITMFIVMVVIIILLVVAIGYHTRNLLSKKR